MDSVRTDANPRNQTQKTIDEQTSNYLLSAGQDGCSLFGNGSFDGSHEVEAIPQLMTPLSYVTVQSLFINRMILVVKAIYMLDRNRR